jgi:hypothetical protein
MNNLDKNWSWHCISMNEFRVDKQCYINRQITRVSLLSLMDEDYYREKGILNINNNYDMVLQNEYIISRMSQYL